MYDDDKDLDTEAEEMKAAGMHAVGEDTDEDPDMVESGGDDGEDEDEEDEDDDEEVE